MKRGWILVWLWVIPACRQARPAAPISLMISPDGPNTRLALLASPGLKLNARLAPAFELAGGPVLRFHSTHLTADSAYFVEPPVIFLPGDHAKVHGIVRASV